MDPNTKKMIPNTDAPDSDAPDAADNNAVYPKTIHLSLCNLNHNRKISPNTKKQIKRT